MSLPYLQQDSSGIISKDVLVLGTVTPNGRIRFVEEGQVPQRVVWTLDFVSAPRHIRDIEASASPKYPSGIGIYVPGRISLGKTAELCGIYYEEIIQESKRRGLHLNFGPETPEEADQELESIRRHIRRSSC